MDIQRKTVNTPTVPAVTSRVTPVFRDDAFVPLPNKPDSHQKGYALGEEQLWYTAPTAPPIQEAHPVVLPKKKKQGIFWNRFSRPRFQPRAVRSWGRNIVLSLGVVLVFCLTYGVLMKGAIEKSVTAGMESAEDGIEKLSAKDFDGARTSLLQAERYFRVARRQMLYFPDLAAKPLTWIPGVSQIGSGVLAVDASTHLVRAGLEAMALTETVTASRSEADTGKLISYLDLLEEAQGPLKNIQKELRKAENSLSAIPLRDIPEEKRMLFELLQRGLPGMVRGIDSLLANTPLVEELLGKNGPRIYLFLFQNNQELRPTGGFIGTYGILEFKNGHARRFFIDGIFNPDGQLKENIVPPAAIQKISASWSMHDSNWFPDFPTSAEKAIFFYEKTGGPTIDGVFTLTPTVMERLLALTGPIELPEYEMVVDSKNFIPTIQEQVEIKYDKEENKPKKVLADLSSVLMERVFAITDPLVLYKMADIFVEGMNERHILLYTRNPQAQALIEESGWSGKIDETPYDYLSVIHTNINGYKTDGVIDETVEHSVQIEEDGSVVATTAITRVHNGGQTPYEWWNKVNSNYMRVYVPKGSQLITASGHTREFPLAPLDYQLLGFKEDVTLVGEESRIRVDEASGTRVGEEFGKTVFGNWVYVSPGETVKVEYTYLLPFRVDPTQENTRSYSLLFQKQAGVDEVQFASTLTYPKEWDIYWKTEEQLLPAGESGIQGERTLRNDLFWGVIFDK